MSIKFLESELVPIAIKSIGKWTIAIGHFEHDLKEVVKAAPILGESDSIAILMEGKGYICFDNESEAIYAFKQIVGDDGPTQLNSYTGPAKVYAVLYNPEGNPITENT